MFKAETAGLTVHVMPVYIDERSDPDKFADILLGVSRYNRKQHFAAHGTTDQVVIGTLPIAMDMSKKFAGKVLSANNR